MLPDREEVAAGIRKLKGGDEATDQEIDLYYKAIKMWHRSQSGPVPIQTMMAIILLLDFFGEEVVESTKASTRGKAKASA